jgi:glucose-6-phosphate isomerase
MVLQTASQQDSYKHFVAVSTNIEKGYHFGIDPVNVFPICGIGGRFHCGAVVGLTVSLAIGYDNFEELLAGANQMDSF